MDRLRALIQEWREKAAAASRLALRYSHGGDDAGNGHAFLKERRIWTTCADELEAALATEPPADGSLWTWRCLDCNAWTVDTGRGASECGHCGTIKPFGASLVCYDQPSAAYKTLYFELLYEVARKHPGESRHETARRYIRQAETPSNAACAAADPPPVQETP